MEVGHDEIWRSGLPLGQTETTARKPAASHPPAPRATNSARERWRHPARRG